MRCFLVILLVFFGSSIEAQTSYQVLKKRLQYGKYYEEYKDIEPEVFAKKKRELSEKHKIYFGEPLNLDTVTIKLSNPFDSLPFPKSYSVLFKGHVVSLMEPGYFLCLNVKTLKRNFELEKKLNIFKHKECYSYNNSVYSLISTKDKTDSLGLLVPDWHFVGKVYTFRESYFHYFNNDNWIQDTLLLPLLKQKVFEDSNFYIANSDEGEWGAHTYLLNKRRMGIQDYHQNSIAVVKIDSANYIATKDYNDNVKLLKLSFNKIESALKIEEDTIIALGKGTYDLFDGRPSVISIFNWGRKVCAILIFRGYTFLTEIRANHYHIIDPLFNDEMYTHEPSTSKVDETVLVNMDFYGKGGSKEVQYLLFTENKVVRVIWK